MDNYALKGVYALQASTYALRVLKTHEFLIKRKYNVKDRINVNSIDHKNLKYETLWTLF